MSGASKNAQSLRPFCVGPVSCTYLNCSALELQVPVSAVPPAVMRKNVNRDRNLIIPGDRDLNGRFKTVSDSGISKQYQRKKEKKRTQC